MKTSFDRLRALIISRQSELSQLGTRHLAIFGSTVRDDMREDSDIDVLVDFDAKKGLFAFANVKFYLEEILQRPVDLVSKQALHPALKKRILGEAKEIF